MDAKYPTGPLKPRRRPRRPDPAWSSGLRPDDLLRQLDPGWLAWRDRGHRVDAPRFPGLRKAS